jgi:hypothetical protein
MDRSCRRRCRERRGGCRGVRLPGLGHLFAESSKADEYQPPEAELMWSRVTEFIARLAGLERTGLIAVGRRRGSGRPLETLVKDALVGRGGGGAYEIVEPFVAEWLQRGEF